MSTEKTREDFEAWMRESAKIIVGSSDPYPAGLERAYWKVWQASRAAIEVELPSLHPAMNTACDNYRSWMNCFRSCKKAIESIGLKVKP